MVILFYINTTYNIRLNGLIVLELLTLLRSYTARLNYLNTSLSVHSSHQAVVC